MILRLLKAIHIHNKVKYIDVYIILKFGLNMVSKILESLNN